MNGAQDASEPSRRRVRIDFDDFQLALEGFDGISGPAGFFLDRETGEVLQLCRDWEDYAELSERLDMGLGDRYERIDALEGRAGFRIMEDFARSRPERRQARLVDALSRRRPFRAFKDAVDLEPGEREEWFAFRDDAHERHMQRWLEERGIDAEVVRRRPGN